MAVRLCDVSTYPQLLICATEDREKVACDNTDSHAPIHVQARTGSGDGGLFARVASAVSSLMHPGASAHDRVPPTFSETLQGAPVKRKAELRLVGPAGALLCLLQLWTTGYAQCVRLAYFAGAVANLPASAAYRATGCLKCSVANHACHATSTNALCCHPTLSGLTC